MPLPELFRLVPGGDPRLLLLLGPKGVVQKGGHALGEMSTDTLFTADGETSVEGKRLAPGKVHGTGCAFASAFATALANGQPPEEALRSAHAFVRRCLLATEPSRDGWPVPIAIVP